MPAVNIRPKRSNRQNSTRSSKPAAWPPRAPTASLSGSSSCVPKKAWHAWHAARAIWAPCAIIVCADTGQAWERKYDGKVIGDIDASIVTDHMMLCAASLGLDTLWICMFKPEAVRAEFNLPEHVEPVNILLVGYGAGIPADPGRHELLRKPLSETVVEERF
mgnify:CR=1 FL=1